MRDCRNERIVDASIAAGLFVLVATLVVVTPGGPRTPAGLAAGLLLALVQAGSVAFIRRWPEPAMAVAILAGIGLEVLAPDIGWLGQVAAVLACYARIRPPRRSLWVLGLLVAATPWKLAGGDWRNMLLAIAGPALGWTLGELGRTRQLRREDEQRRVAAQERERIARELHDVLAHTVSVIVVQAAAAEDVFDRRPDLARKALGTIGSAARSTLAELRVLLQSVSADADGEPQPGLAQLDTLADSLQATGLRVELRRDDTDLPAAVDLSAYRIVQESLTNTLRHSHARLAHVSVRCADGTVSLEISDDGPARAAGRVDGTRRGIVGMRERARLLGGTLDAGPTAEGGFRVRADLPLEPVEMTIRVLIADDQELVRAGFAMIIDSRDDLEVVGEAGDGVQAVALARSARPDVVLMDVRMPRMDGIEATRQLALSGSPARVIMLTTFDLDEPVFAALRAGASGFLLKDTRPDDLAEAVRVVARGEALLAPTVTRRLLDRFAGELPGGQPPPSLAVLSEREVEVLRLVARALSNDEIAAELTLSRATVKTHLSAILFKLGLRDRVQAAVLAYEVGLVRPGTR